MSIRLIFPLLIIAAMFKITLDKIKAKKDGLNACHYINTCIMEAIIRSFDNFEKLFSETPISARGEHRSGSKSTNMNV